MKYKSREISYNIDIKYDILTDNEKENPTTSVYPWIYMSRNYGKYLPLMECGYCGFNIDYNLCTYKNIKYGFVECTLYIHKLIKKYLINECLIYGNTTYFLESLLYYNIKKIGWYPDSIEPKRKFGLYYVFNKIQKKNNSINIIIENNESTNTYKNIIIYITTIAYQRDIWTPTPENREFIYYILNAMKRLKKNGNLCIKLRSNKKQEFDKYTKELIYIISLSFKYVRYIMPEYLGFSAIVNNMIIFENYNENITLIQDIVNKMDENKIIVSMLKIEYDYNFEYFFKRMKKKMFKEYNKLKDDYLKKNDIYEHISQTTNDKIYKKQYMLQLDKCVYLFREANLEIDKTFLIKSEKYKKKIKKIMVKIPIGKYYTLEYQKFSTMPESQKKFLDTVAEYYALKLYISLKKENKLNNMIKKISISKYIEKNISLLINVTVSKKFIELYEILDKFKLIDVNKQVETLNMSNDDILTIKYYYKQYNKTEKILLNLNYMIDTQKIINTYKNIDLVTFECDYSYNILLSYILISLKTLKIGGNSIFKINIIDIDDKILLFIKILFYYFNDIHVYKSGIDPFSNNEIYIIADNKYVELEEEKYNSILAHISNNTLNIGYKLDRTDTMIYNVVVKILQYIIKYMYITLYYYENIDVYVLNMLNLYTKRNKNIKQYIEKINIK